MLLTAVNRERAKLELRAARLFTTTDDDLGAPDRQAKFRVNCRDHLCVIWYAQAVDLVKEWGAMAVNVAIIPWERYLVSPYTHSDVKDLYERKTTYRGGTCE